jgi:hypothetical protein
MLDIEYKLRADKAMNGKEAVEMVSRRMAITD